MSKVTLQIDGRTVEADEGTSILFAALAADTYIPHLCTHPSVSELKNIVLDERVYQGTREFIGEHAGETVLEAEAKGCGLCKVHVEGYDHPVAACRIAVTEGMVVRTTGDDLTKVRQAALSRILAEHPHACLLCEQREGCSRTECSMNVPEEERCCVLLGHCEIGKVADYVGYAPDLPPYRAPEEKIILKDPLFIRDYSLCIGCLKCVRACREIAGADVLGAVLLGGRFVVGTKKPGDMPEAECRFCGACVEICPTGALRDREGVETPAGGAPLPCIHACPAGVDVPRYVRRIAEGDLDGARRVIAASVPLPATLGYACFHPCEDHCRRGVLDRPVAICDLKRFVFQEEEDYPALPRLPDTGKRVAIIGAGPAGLAAAWMLGIKGHKITLFDAGSEPGGFLRSAIPPFRLPREALEMDLKFLRDLGIEFQGNRRLGDDLDPRTLREFGYDAVLLALGTPRSKHIEVEGVELEGVLWGIEFLRSVVSDEPIVLDGEVIVVGGGGVAMDTAMTALRCGAEHVEVISLESAGELPAHEEEVELAREEGITLTHGWGPARFLAGDGRVAGAEFVRCTRVYDSNGRFAPEFAEGDRITRPARWVILAVGQVSDRDAFGSEAGRVLDDRGLLPPEAESVETWLPGFFGAGDLVHGPTSIVEAIASGKRAAASIDSFLGGDGAFELEVEDGGAFDAAAVSLGERRDPPRADPLVRKTNFEPIRGALDPLEAEAAANRCLRCDIRRLILPPVLPPESWSILTSGVAGEAPDAPGVVQMADASGKVLRIKGTDSIRGLIEEWLGEAAGGEPPALRKVKWEEDPMYTKRESELIQQHLQQHGEMPGGAGDELDDLF